VIAGILCGGNGQEGMGGRRPGDGEPGQGSCGVIAVEKVWAAGSDGNVRRRSREYDTV
jgi:hypothetical protein